MSKFTVAAPTNLHFNWLTSEGDRTSQLNEDKANYSSFSRTVRKRSSEGTIIWELEFENPDFNVNSVGIHEGMGIPVGEVIEPGGSISINNYVIQPTVKIETVIAVPEFTEEFPDGEGGTVEITTPDTKCLRYNLGLTYINKDTGEFLEYVAIPIEEPSSSGNFMSKSFQLNGARMPRPVKANNTTGFTEMSNFSVTLPQSSDGTTASSHDTVDSLSDGYGDCGRSPWAHIMSAESFYYGMIHFPDQGIVIPILANSNQLVAFDYKNKALKWIKRGWQEIDSGYEMWDRDDGYDPTFNISGFSGPEWIYERYTPVTKHGNNVIVHWEKYYMFVPVVSAILGSGNSIGVGKLTWDILQDPDGFNEDGDYEYFGCGEEPTPATTATGPLYSKWLTPYYGFIQTDGDACTRPNIINKPSCTTEWGYHPFYGRYVKGTTEFLYQTSESRFATAGEAQVVLDTFEGDLQEVINIPYVYSGATCYKYEHGYYMINSLSGGVITEYNFSDRLEETVDKAVMSGKAVYDRYDTSPSLPDEIPMPGTEDEDGNSPYKYAGPKDKEGYKSGDIIILGYIQTRLCSDPDDEYYRISSFCVSGCAAWSGSDSPATASSDDVEIFIGGLQPASYIIGSRNTIGSACGNVGISSESRTFFNTYYTYHPIKSGTSGKATSSTFAPWHTAKCASDGTFLYFFPRGNPNGILTNGIPGEEYYTKHNSRAETMHKIAKINPTTWGTVWELDVVAELGGPIFQKSFVSGQEDQDEEYYRTEHGACFSTPLVDNNYVYAIINKGQRDSREEQLWIIDNENGDILRKITLNTENNQRNTVFVAGENHNQDTLILVTDSIYIQAQSVAGGSKIYTL